MSKRADWTPERRKAERDANRARMARARAAMTPEERAGEVIRRKAREAEKAKADPLWEAKRKARRSKTLRRYMESRRFDQEFWSRRKSYLARWRAERRIDEEFEAFMARIESDEIDHD